jgi:hypothetical protein
MPHASRVGKLAGITARRDSRFRSKPPHQLRRLLVAVGQEIGEN